MTGFTKKQLIARAQRVSEINSRRLIATPDATGLAMDNALFEIALAALTAEPAAWEIRPTDITKPFITGDAGRMRREIKCGSFAAPLYRLPEIE